MAISKRLVMRSGFGIMIGLLIVSTVMAYRIQESSSQRSVEIHRKFVVEQESLTNLRRTLWMGGIALRDFFINPSPDTSAYREQVERLEADGRNYLAQLRKTSSQPAELAALEAQFSELWEAVRLPATTDWKVKNEYEFVQQEVVPRRDAAGKILRQIEKANHASLSASEHEFSDTRTGATQRLLLILGVCLLCGVLVATFAMRHSEHLEQEATARFAEVSDAKRELESLSARLMEVQEEERTRLSRELHDEIVQNLAVLKLDIAHAQAAVAKGGPDAGEALARARKLAERTVHTVRDISLLLRPSLLDDLGLVPALQWQTEEFTKRTGVQCDFKDNLVQDDFTNAVKTCVFRVTQEALRNCEKHSQATRVSVSLEQIGSELRVEIKDNGIGFQRLDSRAPGQLGVLGMRERATSLGGQLVAANLPGGGAVLRLALPLPPGAAPGMTLAGAGIDSVH